MKNGKLLILGAAGQISRLLTDAVLDRSDMELVLYGRRLSERLELNESSRVTIIDGDFNDKERLIEAMEEVDVVYLNAMDRPESVQTIVEAMEETGVTRLIGATIGGIEDEFPAPLDQWTKDNLPESYRLGEIKSAQLVKESDLNYTLLRLTWLYDDANELDYEFVPSGEVFKDAEISREAVVEGLMEILLSDQPEAFHRQSLGLGQPNTHYDKPSFY